MPETMASSPIFEEWCDNIKARVMAEGDPADLAGTRKFLKESLQEAKKNHPQFEDKTVTDVYHCITEKIHRARMQIEQEEPPKPEDFWNAAYDFNPLGQAGFPQLLKFLRPNRFEVIPLGQLYGCVQLGLIPAMGALPPSDLEMDITKLPVAKTDSGAISYADGHPSEDSHSGPQYETVTRCDIEDDVLRRFASLGWIVQMDEIGQWELTAHVLVIDMDRGRDHHPWIVLAHEWPGSEGECALGDSLAHAPEKVKRDDRRAKGVFPGDRNRTTIGKLVLKHEPQKVDTRPFLKRFAEDFEFDVMRKGGPRRVVDSQWGPDLAHVSIWYWDEETKEEVCYGKDHREYMRHNRETGDYRYPNLKLMSTDGEQGLFGELRAAPKPPKKTDLAKKMAGRRMPKDCQRSMGPGF